MTSSPARKCVLATLVLLATASPAATQRRDSIVFPPARADALSGLYLLEDGRLVQVTDLRDEVGGQPTLSATEYASGRTRALFPRKDGGFEAGNAWFRRDSIAYRVRFDERDQPARMLTWEEGGRVLRGHRAPLGEREVAIENGDVRLAGTLVLPAGAGPHPAVVMVSGSGPETRRISRYVGDLLAYHGIAVLVTDKRGTGGSTGTWNGLSHADWATDVEAQLDFLHAQPDIDPARLGLFGNSESGYVVPVVAARRPDVRFLVCRVCAALPHAETILDTQTGILRRRGLADADVAKVRELLERMIRYALRRSAYDSLVAQFAGGAGQKWRESAPLRQIPAADARYWDVYRGVLLVDPAEHYARLHIPVLVVLGEADDRILVQKHRPVFESLVARGVDLTLWVIPGTSHGLMLGAGNALGYPPGLHDRLVDWMVGTAGVAGAGVQPSERPDAPVGDTRRRVCPRCRT